MNTHDCILINGDSYSATTKHKVYGDFLSEHFGIPVKNFALPGSNNQRILRSSIEYLHQIKSEYNNPLVIIGWSFIRRLEVWYYGNNKTLLNQMPDSDQSRFITLDRVLNSGEATVEQKALVNEDLFIHKQLMDFYTNLYMFAHLLESQNLSYVFFSGAKNTDCPVHCFPYINSLEQVNWVTNNPNIFKLHNFCIMEWAKENDPDCHPVTGHLSTVGHQKFTRFILDNLLS
jgi:hypothetical protein